MFRVSSALVALFLCLAPASAANEGECRPLDRVLDVLAEQGREHLIIEPGGTLESLRRFYAEAPPESAPPAADRALAVAYPRAVLVLFIQGTAACSPLMTDAPEIRGLIFGMRL